MKTKLFAVTLILFILMPQASGQTKRKKADAGIRFGVLAGGGIQTFTGSNYWGDDLGHKPNPGAHAGANVILPVIGDLWIQPGVNAGIKGSRQHVVTDGITKTTNLGYVEVPVIILYRPQLGDGHLLLGAGPYGAYGVMGNERTKIGDVTTELKVRFKGDAVGEPATFVYYRGIDAGAGALIGYELYNGLFAHLNGQLGLLKLNSDYGLPNDQTAKKNLGFSVSAGFRF